MFAVTLWEIFSGGEEPWLGYYGAQVGFYRWGEREWGMGGRRVGEKTVMRSCFFKKIWD